MIRYNGARNWIPTGTPYSMGYSELFYAIIDISDLIVYFSYYV